MSNPANYEASLMSLEKNQTEKEIFFQEYLSAMKTDRPFQETKEIFLELKYLKAYIKKEPGITGN